MDANLFHEGAIYYYENKTNSKKDYENESLNHDFIVSRPVYVIDASPVPFDVYTVNVLLITSSSNRTGIPINVTGYRNGKILPYSVYSVHKEYLTRYLGSVSEEMKSEIKEALKFHLGMSKETPKYISEFLESKKMEESFFKELTIKEKSIYHLFKESCVFQKTYFTRLQEFVSFYKSRCKSKNEKYTRLCDITKSITKMKKVFPGIELDVYNDERVITGVSIDGNVHKMEYENSKKNAKGIATEEAEIQEDLDDMTREQLLSLLSRSQSRDYDKLDFIMKIQNYKKRPEDFDFHIQNIRHGRIVKRLMTFDVQERMQSVKKKLKDGANPYSLNHMCQYLVYCMSDKEIKDCVNSKYLSKGVGNFRKAIKQRIHYLFKRVSF